MTPQTARTDEQIAQLERDHIDTPDFWICVDATTVTLTKQRNGEAPTAEISMPKGVFDRFVSFYTGTDGN
jgi:hypothetical protein